MSAPADWQEELKDLCEAVIEERLTPEQVQRLEQLVLEHPQARRIYVEHLQLHACLHWPSIEPEKRNAEREPDG